MNYVAEKNNRVYISGEIVSDATFPMKFMGRAFTSFPFK